MEILIANAPHFNFDLVTTSTGIKRRAAFGISSLVKGSLVQTNGILTTNPFLEELQLLLKNRGTTEQAGVALVELSNDEISQDGNVMPGKLLLSENRSNDVQILRPLMTLCGGTQNVTASLQLVLKAPATEAAPDHQRRRGYSYRIQPEMLINEKDLQFQAKTPEFTCELKFNKNIKEAWRNSSALFTGSLKLFVKLNDDAISHINILSKGGYTQSLNRKILESANNSGDLVIETSDDVNVKCHKIFLMAASDVFRAMLESKMQESLTSSINIPDLSGESAQALVEYIYCTDIVKLSKSSFVALELLMAAEKYQMTAMHEVVKDMILLKNDDWFSVSTALKIWSFAKKLDKHYGFCEIKQKTLQALKSKSVTEFHECANFNVWGINASS